jgi:hypothetical protein
MNRAYRGCMRPRVVVRSGVLLLVTVAGCSSSRSDRPQPALLSSPTTVAPAATPTCPASADFPQQEMPGVGEGDVTLWALMFSPRAVADQEIKIAWRMTGSGDLTMTAIGPGSRAATPAWGPESHTGSSFDQPGDEWGTGWVFTEPGCWTIIATRTEGTARFTLRVA